MDFSFYINDYQMMLYFLSSLENNLVWRHFEKCSDVAILDVVSVKLS